MIIYHNSRCKNSRAGLELVQSKGLTPEIKLYIKDGLNREELMNILDILNTPAENLVRKQEPFYKKNLKNKNLSKDEWLDYYIEEPKLLKRPIIIDGDDAVVGDPIDKLEMYLDEKY